VKGDEIFLDPGRSCRHRRSTAGSPRARRRRCPGAGVRAAA
jgi:hypothetical protein